MPGAEHPEQAAVGVSESPLAVCSGWGEVILGVHPHSPPGLCVGCRGRDSQCFEDVLILGEVPWTQPGPCCFPLGRDPPASSTCQMTGPARTFPSVARWSASLISC